MYVYIDDYGVFKASHLDETLYNPVYKILQRQIWVTYSILYNGSNNTILLIILLIIIIIITIIIIIQYT